MNRLQTLVATNLRRLRTERGLTQAQLAAAVGRSTDLISRIERAEAAPSFETLEKLCLALGIPAVALFSAPMNDADLAARIQGRVDVEADELAWLQELVRIARARPRR